MKGKCIIVLLLVLSVQLSVKAQQGRKELLTGLSVIQLTNRGYDRTGLGIDLGFLYHFTTQSAVLVDLEGVFLPRRRYQDINVFDFRLGYRYTFPGTAVYLQPNIGFASARFYREAGYYNGFLKAMEMGVRLPSKKRSVELAVNINDADRLPNTVTPYERRLVWLGFKAAVVFPVR